MLVALGQIFQIEELTQLHLEQAQAKYRISPGVVTIDELILRSPNIHLSATGTVSFSGKLHLASRLAINEKIRSQLFKPIRSNFQPTDEPGYSAVDFEVGGTLDRPKTNLLEKVVGRDLRDLGKQLMGRKGRAPEEEETSRNTARGADWLAIAFIHAEGDQAGNCGYPGPFTMRVIAGRAGGVRLAVPKSGVRPTMDRVKAAIFSSLGDVVIGARVLDLFAGSGGLGIEALSRGAASVLFVDEDRQSIAAIEKNLDESTFSSKRCASKRFLIFCGIGLVRREIPDHFCRSALRKSRVG